jgi:hypothetical protein
MHLVRYCFLFALLSASSALWAQPVFTPVDDPFGVAVSAWGLSWVDADADGDLDLFVGRAAGATGNQLFINEGGAFDALSDSPLTNATSALGHTWADYDNDGDLDVLTVGNPSVLYRNDGDLAFTPVGEGPLAPAENNRGWSGAWGDYDGDGFVDVVIAHPDGFVGDSQENHLFHNEGDGTFTRTTDTPITEGLDAYTIPSWSDYDLDGDLDLFIGSGPISSAGADNLYENTGNGAFARITTDPIATDDRDGQVMNWIDHDNDGDLDLYVTSYTAATNLFYRNESPDAGAGPYVRVETTVLNQPVSCCSTANTWGDFDNDGDLDVFVAVGRLAVSHDGFNQLYINEGDGTFSQDFENEALTETQETTSGATVGDFDNDGDLDLATSSASQSTPNLRLYRNDTDNGNSWLKLNLVGTASNRAAIGAKVRATATIGGAPVTQFREVSAQNTFSGQNALTVHFGLGDASSASTLEITWPSGTVDTFEGVSANGFFEVMEGGSLVAVANAPSAPAVPHPAGLMAAYPNPFAQSVTIRYTTVAGPVRLTVYDVLGRRVRTLLNHAQPAGTHTVRWDGTDGAGRSLSAGVYVYRLEAGGEVLSRSLTLLP